MPGSFDLFWGCSFVRVGNSSHHCDISPQQLKHVCRVVCACVKQKKQRNSEKTEKGYTFLYGGFQYLWYFLAIFAKKYHTAEENNTKESVALMISSQ